MLVASEQSTGDGSSLIVYDSCMAHDARAVANFILDYAEAQGRPLTDMALLKLLYFVHGWHLAQTGAPLIRNQFEAWKHGPVVRVVYECFRNHGKNPIGSRAMRFDPQTGRHEMVSYSFNDFETAFIKNIFDAYGRLDALQLSDLTHEPGSPWDMIWNAPNGRVTLGMRISNESIRDHFLGSPAARSLH
jgi:uncharacterized phage-associated protein